MSQATIGGTITEYNNFKVNSNKTEIIIEINNIDTGSAWIQFMMSGNYLKGTMLMD